jgi:hypothetical protein
MHSSSYPFQVSASVDPPAVLGTKDDPCQEIPWGFSENHYRVVHLVNFLLSYGTMYYRGMCMILQVNISLSFENC